MKKILLFTLGGLFVLLFGLFVFVSTNWEKKFDAPYPEISASTDSTIIARGKYLAYGPAHCATCHVPMDKIIDVENGEEFPLVGGWELDIPPGTFRAPNITPDPETGIGKYTDAELARTLRHSVKPDGSMLFPFMPFQEMSDEDLTAVISFLRSQKPVKNYVKPTEAKFLGKAVMALGLIKPEGPAKPPVKQVKRDSSVLYGSYIARSVANCFGCHTERDPMTGAYTGPEFAGGGYFEPDTFSGGYSFVTPNLTPDKNTGIMASWDEQAFITRFRTGRVHKGSPMPWGAFSRIDEVELKALYRYFSSLPAIERKIEKVVYAPGERLSD